MSSEKPVKAFSCVRCFERKVKCDKSHPCAGCVRSNIECIFRIPAAPRRRKKQIPDDVVLAKLKHYESLLQANGIDTSLKSPPLATRSSTDGTSTQYEQSNIDQESPDPIRNGSQHSESLGRLIVDHGKSRFIENFLWNSLSDQFHPNDAVADSSDEEDLEGIFEDQQDFMLGLTPSSHVATSFHPSADHAFKMWQFFLDNVHPMTKILHQQSFEPILTQASSKPENIPKGLECLLFAVYAMSILSLFEDDCLQLFGESKRVLLSRYREGVRRSLARAKFMATGDMMVLQAFVLYLICMRNAYDARTLWTMTGIASRIAQSLGVHRDGAVFGLSPFETEMRRRLWWQICIMDFRSGELTGSGRFGDTMISNVKVSSNYDDADLDPAMTELPAERARPGEMICCSMRCEFGKFWKEKIMFSYPQKMTYTTSLSDFIITASTLEERDRNVNELETIIQEKYLKYCDPCVPIEFMTTLIGRAAINAMRLQAHHPRRWTDDSEIPAEEKQLLWDLSLKALEVDNLCYTYPLVRRFNWHSQVFFQWQSLIFLLGELQHRTLGPEVDKAWRYIDESFLYHAFIVEDRRQPVHVAVGNLCLKAYNAREQALLGTGRPYTIPQYIHMLRQQRQPSPRQSKGNIMNGISSQIGVGPNSTLLSGLLKPNHQPPPVAQRQLSMDNSPRFEMSLNAAVPEYFMQQAEPVMNDLSYFDNGMGGAEYMYGEIPHDWSQWENLFSNSNTVK